MRMTASCRSPQPAAAAAALHAFVLVRQRSAVGIPIRQAIPMTIVIAVSTGEKCPVMTRAQPSRKSQMNVMMTSQKISSGSAVHLASSRC